MVWGAQDALVGGGVCCRDAEETGRRYMELQAMARLLSKWGLPCIFHYILWISRLIFQATNGDTQMNTECWVEFALQWVNEIFLPLSYINYFPRNI